MWRGDGQNLDKAYCKNRNETKLTQSNELKSGLVQGYQPSTGKVKSMHPLEQYTYISERNNIKYYIK